MSLSMNPNAKLRKDVRKRGATRDVTHLPENFAAFTCRSSSPETAKYSGTGNVSGANLAAKSTFFIVRPE